MPDVVVTSEDETDMTETSPLLPRERLPSSRKPAYEPQSEPDDQSADKVLNSNRLGHQYPTIKGALPNLQRLRSPKNWNFHHIVQKAVVEPVFMLPSVFLGLLLNLLDALSYGIILFPLGEEVFQDLGPDGVSMFYVSCIISQVVYSTGSIFKGGVGSEMIEVVPFVCYLLDRTFI